MHVTYKTNHGFTLIEILIAIALLTMMLALLFNSLFTISRSWNSGYSQVTANDEYRLTCQFIKKYISQSIATKWRNGDKQTLMFSGDEHEVIFVSPLPAHRGGGGLAVIKLDVMSEQNKQLVMHYEYADPVEIETILTSGPRNEAILIDNVELLELSYYGAKKSNEPVDWHDNWHDAELMPTMIKMMITPSGSSRSWPEMLIPVYSQSLTLFPEFIIESKPER